eukprot:jgi/Ulvmu1/8707/UM047_0047.1
MFAALPVQSTLMQGEGGRWSRRRSVARLEDTPARSEACGAVRASRAVGPVARAQCRVAMLQSKLRSAELRMAGQCETIKVLEASLSAKDGELQRLEEDRQAAVALAKRPPASPKPRRRSLKAAGVAASHTEPLLAARRAERELKARVRQLEEEAAAARAAAGEERSRAAALREGVRRAQEARRAAERQRDDAVAVVEGDRKAIAGLRARVKTLQASLEQETHARAAAEGRSVAATEELDVERSSAREARRAAAAARPQMQQLRADTAAAKAAAAAAEEARDEARAELDALATALRQTRSTYLACAQDNAMLKAALAHTQEGVKAMQSIFRHRGPEGAPAAAGAGDDAEQDSIAGDAGPPVQELSFRHDAGLPGAGHDPRTDTKASLTDAADAALAAAAAAVSGSTWTPGHLWAEASSAAHSGTVAEGGPEEEQSLFDAEIRQIMERTDAADTEASP